MGTTLVAALAFSLSQFTLSIALLLVQRRRWSTQEWLFCLFLSAAIAYLLGPILEGHWTFPIQTAWENTLPGLFWLFCGSLFNDRFRLSIWNVSIVALTVILPTLARNLIHIDIHLPVWLFISIPQIVEFILIAAALFVVVQSWQDDLIETRRDLRFWFCSMAGVYIFVMIAIREVLFPEATWWTELQYLPIGIICLVTNILLLQYRPGLLYFDETHMAEAITQKIRADHRDITTKSSDNNQTGGSNNKSEVEVPEDIIEQLSLLMEEECIYREMGLTIGQVAERLELPEYKLRKIINAGLGYRNFNDYLNGFRIKEAGERLSDPDQSHEAVLNIALDTGFRSLSSFNKAFREFYGRTPTEYRKIQLSQNS